MHKMPEKKKLECFLAQIALDHKREFVNYGFNQCHDLWLAYHEQEKKRWEELPKEIVICAAIKFKCGKIIRGHRHGDCVTGSTYRDEEKPDTKGAIQGFITSMNRFVTREEGRKLQDAAGIKSVQNYIADTLFSEDLY